MEAKVFDPRVCVLGEGPLWHPERQQLFWVDIINRKMLTRVNGKSQEWQFDQCVSAAGWIDMDNLIIASETGLHRFDVNTGQMDDLMELEANNPVTRSNDGRADPWGGFWIGTMGKRLERNAGAIYRFFEGKLEKLYPDITIPNAICFSPDKAFAYFTDTAKRQIMHQPLDSAGWPTGEPRVLIDLNAEKINPDGAVTDRDGNIWNAQWGASRVACYSPDGVFLRAVSCPGSQTTCPAFGGDDLSSLFVTSANEGLKEPQKGDGQTFVFERLCVGLPEPRVRI